VLTGAKRVNHTATKVRVLEISLSASLTLLVSHHAGQPGLRLGP